MMERDYKEYVLVQQARLFATAAHAAIGQKRKYTGEDYIVHPAEVAELVTQAGGSTAMIQAAWLHDVVEDTSVTIETIRAVFGEEVAMLVDGLTDKSKPEDGPRAIRKMIDRARLAAACGDVQTIKLADLVSNTKSIVEHDAKFAAVYLDEKAMMLNVMRDGNTWLWNKANNILINSLKELEITL